MLESPNVIKLQNEITASVSKYFHHLEHSDINKVKIEVDKLLSLLKEYKKLINQ